MTFDNDISKRISSSFDREMLGKPCPLEDFAFRCTRTSGTYSTDASANQRTLSEREVVDFAETN